jgi:hypothetical protein
MNKMTQKTLPNTVEADSFPKTIKEYKNHSYSTVDKSETTIERPNKNQMRFNKDNRDANMSIFSNSPNRSINLFKMSSLIKSKLRPLAGYKVYTESLEEKHFIYFNTTDSIRVSIEIFISTDQSNTEYLDGILYFYSEGQKIHTENLTIPPPHDYNWEPFLHQISYAMSKVLLSRRACSDIRKIMKEFSNIKENACEIDGMDFTFGDDLDVLIDFNFRDSYIIYEVEVGRGIGEEFDSFSFYYNRDPKVAIFKSVERARKFVSRMFHKMKQIPILEFTDPEQDTIQETNKIENEKQSITDLLNLE